MSTPLAPPATRLITGEELYEMGDIGPCELIDGKIVPMSPAGGRHGSIAIILGTALILFVQQNQRGWVMGGAVGVYVQRNPDRVRGADIAFIAKGRLDEIPDGFLAIAPDLIVEVVSPTDRWTDIRQKIKEYFAIGVVWVWVVEPDNRAVLVYRSSTEMQQFTEQDTLVGEGALEGFSLPLTDLFGTR